MSDDRYHFWPRINLDAKTFTYYPSQEHGCSYDAPTAPAAVVKPLTDEEVEQIRFALQMWREG